MVLLSCFSSKGPYSDLEYMAQRHGPLDLKPDCLSQEATTRLWLDLPAAQQNFPLLKISIKD